MADLFVSRSFHCLWLPPSLNFPPKPSKSLQLSAPIRWSSFSSTHHNRMLANSTSSSTSVPVDDDDDVHIISTTKYSDGSFMFRFGNASEIRENIGELEQQRLVPEFVEEVEEAGVSVLLSDGVENLSSEVLGEEIQSSSTVLVGVADRNPPLLKNEKESVALDSDPETPVINDSQNNNRVLKLDSVVDDDGQHGILSEDVAVERNVFANVSEEDSQADISHKEAMVSTVSPESDVFSDLSIGASGSGEFKEKEVDKGHDVDRAANSLTGGVDAELSELVPVSTFLESQPSVDMATNNLNGSVDGDTSESVPESEQVGYSATNILQGGVDADLSELVPVSTSVESERSADGATNNPTGSADVDISKLVPVSTSLESERSADGATDNLTGRADADISELVPVSTSLKSEPSVDGETNNLTGSATVDMSELQPVSTSLESEEVDNSVTDDLIGSADDNTSQLVPVSTPLESKQSVNGATSHLTAGVDAELSEFMPVSTTLESEQVYYSSTDNLTGGIDVDLSELAPVTTSFESELLVTDEETTHVSLDDSVDASKMGKSAMLHNLVPSSDLENKTDVGNTEGSDYENPSRITLPEIHSIEIASHGEETSRTELILVSGAACLPHPSKALTGREDAYFISRQNWLAVADGVGQWSFEGSNTGLYIRELMEKCENIVSNYENISAIKPAEVLARSATETQTPGSSSALVAYFDGQALHTANVGNTGFIIIRDGSVFKKSNAMFHEFSFPLHLVKGDDHSEIIEEYKIDLHNGDVIIFATNGLFDNLYAKEIASTISKSLQASLRPQEIAELVALKAQEVGRSTSTRSPFGDAAQAMGYVGYAGGKLDDVTVIVSLVQNR